MHTAEEIIRVLQLKPHPREGGFFAEIYRSSEAIPESALPSRYKGARSFGTAIYYLLTPSTFSEMHRLSSDEIFHFYLGDPVEMLQLDPEGSAEIVTIGPGLQRGERPQVVVKKNVWQGSRLKPGGRFALLGTTVAPSFEFADYEAGQRDALAAAFPLYANLISALTRM